MTENHTVRRTAAARPLPRGPAAFFASPEWRLALFAVGGTAVTYLGVGAVWDACRPDSIDWQVYLALLAVLAALRLPLYLAWQHWHLAAPQPRLEERLRRVGTAVSSAGLFAFAVDLICGGLTVAFPMPVLALEPLLYLLYLSWAEDSLRLLRFRHRAPPPDWPEGQVELWNRKAVLIGDPAAVATLARELLPHPNILYGNIIGTMSQIPGTPRAEGFPWLGTSDNLPSQAARMNVGAAILLPPANTAEHLRQLALACAAAWLPMRFFIFPPLIPGRAAGRSIRPYLRPAKINDLLPPHTVLYKRPQASPLLAERVVMVTGAGGTIGAEIVRQIAWHEPAAIVLFENSEAALARIVGELEMDTLASRILPFCGDVRFLADVQRAVTLYGVQTIFHTASSKHAPLMEQNLAALVRNDVLGVSCLARAAEHGRVDRVVLVSSDKAAQPTNMLGACQRLAERVLLERPRQHTSFVAVRFANVVESSGNALELFARQIEHGGPVTVCTPACSRSFLPLAEAVDGLLLGACVAADRETIRLDSGPPWRMAELARLMIVLAGQVPEVDIPILYTGLRAGDTETDQPLGDDEVAVPTEFPRLERLEHRDQVRRPPLDLEELHRLVIACNDDALRVFIHDALSGYPAPAWRNA